MACAVAASFLLLDSSGQPCCHKQVDLALSLWLGEQEQENQQFPNADGSSAKSLAWIAPYLNGEDLSDRYMYVPGLSRSAPGDLVLMYVRQPTRWVWHGSTPWVVDEKAWVVVPVDMTHGPD